MKKFLLFLFVTCIIGSVAIYAINYTQLQTPLNEVLQSDHRNKGIEVSVHYSNYISPNTLVFDLTDISGNNSRTDVFRVLLQYAHKIQTERFRIVELSYKGKTKFLLDGNYFQKIGKEYDLQNPVYTMRTFTENLKTAEGNKAYSTWSGGLLGVLNKQIEDFNDFHDKWYMNAYLTSK